MNIRDKNAGLKCGDSLSFYKLDRDAMTHDVKVWEKLFMARTIDKDSILRAFWLTETARFIYQKTKKKKRSSIPDFLP